MLRLVAIRATVRWDVTVSGPLPLAIVSIDDKPGCQAMRLLLTCALQFVPIPVSR